MRRRRSSIFLRDTKSVHGDGMPADIRDGTNSTMNRSGERGGVNRLDRGILEKECGREKEDEEAGGEAGGRRSGHEDEAVDAAASLAGSAGRPGAVARVAQVRVALPRVDDQVRTGVLAVGQRVLGALATAVEARHHACRFPIKHRSHRSSQWPRPLLLRDTPSSPMTARSNWNW